jgi:mycothiol synthase
MNTQSAGPTTGTDSHGPERVGPLEPMAGLIFRPWRGADDVAAMARVANASNDADTVDERTSPEELLNFFIRGDEHFDPGLDLTVVELAGELIAYGWVGWADTTDGLREYRLGGYVHPAWRRRGVGHRLLAWQEDRARAIAAGHDVDRPRVFGTWSPEARAGKRALVEASGFRPVRWFFEMQRTDLDTVDVPPLPDSIEVRPIGTDRASLRGLFDADAEAFKDHWGGWNATDANFEEWLSDPKFDPSLFVVAWEGDQIAGAVINTISAHENAAFNRQRGWLDSVFVRRPWRRRGLAQALVARSLIALRERGITEAMLGVDSENPTGAVGVYERAGFTVAHRGIAYRKSWEENG